MMTEDRNPPNAVDMEETDVRDAKKARRSRSSLQTPLETYLREINETKLLTADDEKNLAKAIAEGDVQHTTAWSARTCVWS